MRSVLNQTKIANNLISKPKYGEDKVREKKSKIAASENEKLEAKETPPQVEEEQFNELKLAHEELKNELLRARADCDNLYKRMHRELLKMQNQGIRGFGFDLCDVLDQFRIAQKQLEASSSQPLNKNLLAGVVLIEKELMRVFKKHGIMSLDLVGKQFNPDLSEAISTVETDQFKPGHVAEEIRKGYMLHGTLLRAAKVILATEKQPEVTKNKK